MRNEDSRSTVVRTVWTVALILVWVSASFAATQKILHNFSEMPHGANPQSNLIADADGNFYGTTYDGGYGVVFELKPTSDDKWTQTISIHLLETQRPVPTAPTRRLAWSSILPGIFTAPGRRVAITVRALCSS